MAPAATGASCRVVERELVRAGICGIRWTPDRAGLDRNPAYYEWIEHGFELHAELRDVGLATIECFPTASWTRWGGSRGEFSRARWSSQVLQGLLELRPGERLNQDRRDALAAALTARAHPRGTECFGDIVVPLKPT
jgi:predicted nuclease with RNAse H fold